MRGIQYAAASQPSTDVSGILDRPVPSTPKASTGLRTRGHAGALAEAASRTIQRS